ncbi:bile acid:sodium symporter [Botrimarina sp.]|uniref:bile acid:sodium symporter n=1 Tax=Botrimarina sp. TaxID=2795802 RepID=UPI0032ED1026
MSGRPRALVWIGKQWFLLALVVVLTLGAVAHGPLAPLTDAIPRGPLVAAIMLAMSAPLNLGRSLSAQSAGAAVAVGVVTNTVLAGPLAWLLGGWLPDELAIGLVVAALAPCTLASAAVWTRRGRGNDAVALAVTVVTNLASFLVLPAWAGLLIARSEPIAVVGLGAQLLAIVVAPIVVGQLLRTLPPARLWCDRHRHALSLAAQVGLLGMVLIGAVRCGAALSDPSARVGAAAWGGLAASAAAVHLVLFAVAWRLSRWLGCPRGEALGAAVSGSQKTLAVGLGVALQFGPLAVLPMIVYHALQLLIDAVLVDRLGPPAASDAGLKAP